MADIEVSHQDDYRRPVLIDARQLWGCRHRLFLDTRERVRPPETPGARQRMDAAAEHRAKVRDELVGRGGDWLVIDSSLPERKRVEATMAACAEGVARIWGAMLPAEPDTGRRGGSEILLRDQDRGGYIPIIVVNHKVTDPRQPEPMEDPTVTSDLSGVLSWHPQPDISRKVRSLPRDQMRLVHLYRMLQRHGVASPALSGGVIGAQLDTVLVQDLGKLLDDYDLRYADRVAVVRGELPTAPSRVPECRTCSWWTQCRPTLEQARDVSLVAVGARGEMLRSLGVDTVDDLAAWTGPQPDDWLWDDWIDTVVAARAWLRDVPLVRREVTVRVRRADVEVDIDLESFAEHGAYLWGTLYDGQYRPFATWDPVPTEDEGRSFGEFWTWLMAIRAQAHASGKTFAAYCYTRTEDKWMFDSARRFAGRPGVPSLNAVRKLVNSREWVDMFQAVTDNFICPHGKGLKKVAPVAGFSWRDPEAGGEASMAWYRDAVGYDGAPPDPVQRQRVLDYNEDDVRATAALREWMTTRAVAETPAIGDL